jgi:hypothetical protein
MAQGRRIEKYKFNIAISWFYQILGLNPGGFVIITVLPAGLITNNPAASASFSAFVPTLIPAIAPYKQ